MRCLAAFETDLFSLSAYARSFRSSESGKSIANFTRFFGLFMRMASCGERV